VIQLVSAQRIREFPEVHLEERRYRVYVLKDCFVLVQCRDPVLVEGVAQFLDVGRDAGQAVDPVHDAVALDELGAALEHHGDVVAGVEEVLAEVAAEHALLQDAGLLEAPSRRP